MYSVIYPFLGLIEIYIQGLRNYCDYYVRLSLYLHAEHLVRFRNDCGKGVVNITGSSGVAIGRGALANVQGDTYSGDFSGAILNVRSTLKNVSQGIGSLPKASDEEKAELEQLVADLEVALVQATEEAPEKANDAEAVAQMTEQLLNTAAAEKPNQTMLKISGEGLKQAAENIAAVMPTVLQIATQIVAVVGAFAI